MLTAQGLHAIEVGVVQFAQVHLVYIIAHAHDWSDQNKQVTALYLSLWLCSA